PRCPDLPHLHSFPTRRSSDLGLRAQFLPTRVGKETMLGKTAPALARIDGGSGKVFVEGEYWNAVSEAPIESGQPVEIVAVEGLRSEEHTSELQSLRHLVCRLL